MGVWNEMDDLANREKEQGIKISTKENAKSRSISVSEVSATKWTLRGARMNKECSPLGCKCFKVGIWGSIAAAICCATPILTFLLGAVGLAFLTRYIDYVLLPLLAAFLLLAVYGWIQLRRVSKRPQFLEIC